MKPLHWHPGTVDELRRAGVVVATVERRAGGWYWTAAGRSGWEAFRQTAQRAARLLICVDCGGYSGRGWTKGHHSHNTRCCPCAVARVLKEEQAR